VSRSYETKIRLTDDERDLIRRAALVEDMTFAKWIRLVALRESKDVVENYETDLRIAAQRERQQLEYMDGIGRN
jgi:uncharacterized protein (DUF1778 family)